MIAKRTVRGLPSHKLDRLVKLLEDHNRVLITAGCDKRMLSEHSALIRFLKGASAHDIRRILAGPALIRKPAPLEPEHSEAELTDIPVNEVERLIDDESTPRKYLERIAIYRFKVPRGSMRSFSNREMLVQKLQTLLRNELSHRAIETVARRHL